MRIASARGPEPWLTVVGVAEDVRDRGDVAETWYLPVTPGGRTALGDRTPFLVVRTRVSPRALADGIARAAAAVDPSQPLSRTATMEEVYGRTLAGPRQGAILSSLVAGFALLLAGLGIHGVLSYGVRMRRREFGVRIALGASPTSILRLVASDGSRLSAAGAILGAGGFLATRGILLRTLDAAGAGAPLSTAGVWISAVPLLALAVVGAWVLPARRAIRVDPVEALRSE